MHDVLLVGIVCVAWTAAAIGYTMLTEYKQREIRRRVRKLEEERDK
jgi:hypothetical protein